MAKKTTDAAAEATTAPAEPQTTDAAAEPQTEQNTERLIYVGASVPGMRMHTVFTGGIPKALDVPFVRECCIRLEDFGKWTRDKLEPTSRASFCFNKSVELAGRLNNKN